MRTHVRHLGDAALVMVSLQGPFALALLLAFFVLGGHTAAWVSLTATALVVLASLVVLIAAYRPKGDLPFVVAGVIDLTAVAVINSTSFSITPSPNALMVFPALWLSYAFRARVAPFIAALVAVPVLTSASLLFVDANPEFWVGAAMQALLVMIVTTVVYLASRRLQVQALALESALAEVRSTVELTQAVADAVEVGITYYDRDGVVQLRNEAVKGFAQRAGYDFETRTATQMFGSDRTTPILRNEQPHERLLRSEHVDGDLVYLGPPGDQRAVTLTGVRLDTGASPRGWVLVTQDVTDLADSIETREEMLRTFSHELRTPLTSILGFLEHLQDTRDLHTLGLAEPIEVIHRNAEHLHAVILDALQAGVDVGAPQPRTQPGHISDIARQTITSFAPKYRERNIELRLDQRCGNDRAEFDPVQVRQALDNLVSNALKYSPPHGHVTVTLQGDDVTVDLLVSDQGSGISPEDVAKLFQRGFRSTSARRGSIQGMGLGLAIARDIARAHNGEITVTSTPGQGSIFTLTLPRRNMDEGGGQALPHANSRAG